MSGYKTAIISLLITILGALESFDFTQILTADNAGYVTAGLGVLMFALRSITNTPLFNK